MPFSKVGFVVIYFIFFRCIDRQDFVSLNNSTASAFRREQPFNYEDDHPLNGINYYWLKMIDGDGKITFSSIITLHNKANDFDVITHTPIVILILPC